MSRVLKRILAGAVIGGLFSGCSDPVPQGPPELRFGRDECAECGMAIEDERFAAAAWVDRGGHAEPALFDDIGCLLDFESTDPTVVLTRYFRDARAKEWISGTPAFVQADRERLRTPMASGMAAYADHADAARTARDSAGEVLTFDQLRTRRQAWKAARSAGTRPPAPPATTSAAAANGPPDGDRLPFPGGE